MKMTSKFGKSILLVLIAIALIAGSFACASQKEKKASKADNKGTEYIEGSTLYIAESYVGEDVQELISELGTLEGKPKISSANDGGGYEGEYKFKGFVAKTYAKSAKSKSVISEIIPDKSSDEYKESLAGENGSGKGGGSSGSVKQVVEDGEYDTKDEVAAYIAKFKKLPSNYITKAEAKKLGWNGGALDKVAKGKAIGGDRFGNREKKLPRASGRDYYECDIDTIGKDSRGGKRIVYSDDGLIYYTDDHYKTFEEVKVN